MRPTHCLYGIAILSLFCASEAPAQSAANQFESRVQMQVNRTKSTRTQGGDWDDKTDRISFSIKFANGDTRQAFDGCQAEFYVLAQSILNPRAFQLLQAEKFTFSLPARGAHAQQTPEVTTRYDKTDLKFGVKYNAWVFLVRDAEGKILMKKTSLNSWLPVAERLGEQSVGAFFDRDLKPANQ